MRLCWLLVVAAAALACATLRCVAAAGGVHPWADLQPVNCSLGFVEAPPAGTFTDSPPLRLAYTGSSSAVLVTLVASLLSALDYPSERVLVPVDEEVNLVAAGTVHATLSHWPTNGTIFIQDVITDANGVVASPGWFVPTYAVDAATAMGETLASYQDLTRPAVAQLLGDVVIVGPPGSISDVACGPSGLFANLGIPMSCEHTADEDALLERLATLYDAGTPFLGFLWQPSRLLALRDFTRLTFPASGDRCFKAKLCDFAPVVVQKKLWEEVHTFFPAALTSLLRGLQLSVLEFEEVLVQVETPESLGPASCAWLQQNAGRVKQWLRLLSLSDVLPATAPTDGGTTVQLVGEGFGRVQPLVVDAFIGDAACTSTDWLNDTHIECVVPPGIGLGHTVSVTLGFVRVNLPAAFDYAPAVLLGIQTPSEASIGLLRAASSGETIRVLGLNFFSGPNMQCRFGEFECMTVPAVVESSTSALCVTPSVSRGAKRLWVTNDGVRWSDGLTVASVTGTNSAGTCGPANARAALPLDAVVWPGGAQDVPLDYGPDRAPAAVTIALASFSKRQPAHTFAANASVAAIASDPDLLRYTRLNVVHYQLDDLEAIATDNARAAAAEAFLAQLLSDHPNCAALVAGSTSDVVIALSVASSKLEHPLPVLGVSSTSPLLTSQVSFPYMVRVVPPDGFQAAALVALLDKLELVLLRAGMITAEQPSVSLVYDPESVYAGGLANQFLSVLDTSAFSASLIVRINSTMTDSELQHHLSALQDSASQVVVTITPTTLQARFLPIVNALGLQRHLWLGSDATAEEELRSGYLNTYIQTTPSPGTGALAVQLTADAETLQIKDSLVDVPFVYDLMRIQALAIDAVVRHVKSPNALDYRVQSDLLMAAIRQVELGPQEAATDFTRFRTGTNDPAAFSYVLNQYHDGEVEAIGFVDDTATLRQFSTTSVALPQGSSSTGVAPPALYVGLPIRTWSADFYTNAAALTAAEAVLEAVNNDTSVLPNTTVHLVIPDANDAVTATQLLAAGNDLVPGHPRVNVTAIVSPLSSGETLASFEERGPAPLPFMVASFASLDQLGNATLYPSFTRVIGGNSDQSDALAAVVTHYRWSTVGLVYEQEPYSADMARAFLKAAQLLGVRVPVSAPLPSTATVADIETELQAVLDSGVRVILLPTLLTLTCRVFTAAAALDMLDGDYVWVGGDGWVTADLPPCFPSDESIAAAVSGSLGTTFGTFTPTNEPTQRFVSALSHVVAMPIQRQVVHGPPSVLDQVDAWRHTQTIGNLLAGSRPLVLGAVADALQSVVKAVSELLTEQQGLSLTAMQRAMRRVDFLGVTGAITINRAGIVSLSDAMLNDIRYPSFTVVNVLNGTSSIIGEQTANGFVNFTGCSPGTTQSTSGVCVKCAVDTYKPHFGNEACEACPKNGDFRMTTDGATGATSLSQCRCPVSLLQVESDDADVFPCLECPAGGQCTKLGLTLPDVVNQPGFWRGNVSSLSYDRCFVLSRCSVTGKTLPVPEAAFNAIRTADEELPWQYSSPCPVGRLGPLCEVCEKGFGKNPSGECAPCPSKGVLALLGLFVSFVAVAFVSLLVYLQLNNKTAPVFSKRRANNLKVLVSYMQYNAFLNFFGVDWSSTMRELLGFQRSASGAAAAVLNWQCMLADDVETPAKLWVFSLYMAGPLVVVAAGLLVYVCLRLCRRQQGTFWVDSIHATSWVILFLLYPTLLTEVLSIFDCVKLSSLTATGTVELLRADMALACSSPLYRQYYRAAVVFAFLYIVGIPLAAYYVLYRRRFVLRASQEEHHPDRIVHLNAADIIALHDTVGIPLDDKDRRVLGVEAAAQDAAAAIADWGAADTAPAKQRSASIASSKGGDSSSPTSSPASTPRRLRSTSIRKSLASPFHRTRRVSVTELPEGQELRTIRERLLLLRGMFDDIHTRWVLMHGAPVRPPASQLNRRSELLQALFEQSVTAVAAEQLSPTVAIRNALVHFRQVLRSQRRFGFLYQGYRPKRAWFEVVSLFRKAAVVSFTVGLAPGDARTQLAVAIIVTGLSLLVSSLLNPFRKLSIVLPVPLYQSAEERAEARTAAQYDLELDPDDPTKAALTSSHSSQLRKLPWVQWLPEVLSSANLDRLSMLVTLLNLALCFVGSPAVAQVGTTQPMVRPALTSQSFMVALHVVMMVAFLVVLVCDTYNHAKLRRNELLRLWHCCLRCCGRTPSKPRIREPELVYQRRSTAMQRRASIERPREAVRSASIYVASSADWRHSGGIMTAGDGVELSVITPTPNGNNNNNNNNGSPASPSPRHLRRMLSPATEAKAAADGVALMNNPLQPGRFASATLSSASDASSPTPVAPSPSPPPVAASSV